MSITEQQFVQTYITAYTSPNPQEREKSSIILNTLLNQNPNLFTNLSLNTIKNPAINITARKLIITGLTKSIRPNNTEGAKKSIFPILDPKTKEDLKNAAFTTLIDKDDNLKHSAGNLIAALYTLDLKGEKKWDGILNSLTQNVKNNDLNIQKAAIITLGYICENLFNDNFIDLSNKDIDTLLGGICMGLEEYGELSKTSVMALGYSISFLKKKLKEESVRDYIFDILVKLLIKAFEKNDVNVLVPTISCLEEISRNVYDDFGKYCGIVFEKILNCYTINDNQIIITINEFFKTLLESEKMNPKNYFENFWKKLAENCLKALLNIDETIEDEEGGLSLTKSFFLLLNTINSVYISQTQNDLKKFVCEYIEKDETRIKVVALIVYESLLESSPTETIYEFINTSFGGLINFISVGDFYLKKHSLEFLKKLAEFHPSIILVDQNFIKISQKFLNILNSPNNSEEDMIIKKQVLKTLEHLANNSEQKNFSQDDINKLRGYVESFFDAIFKSLNNCQNLQYINDAFTCIFSFLRQICSLESLSEFYKFFQNMMIQASRTFSNKEIQIAYIESFLINLTTMLNRVHQSNNSKLEIGNNTDEFLRQGYNFISDYCQKNNEIPDESLYFMSLVLKNNPIYFENEVNNFLNTFITPALQVPNKKRLFKNGIDAFVTIIKSFENQSKNYITKIIPHFLNFLKNPEFDRELNKNIFYSFADIAFNFNDCLKNYLEELFQIIKFASDAILHFFKSDIRSNVLYANELTSACIHLIICILYGFYLNENGAKFKNFENMIEKNVCEFILFLENVCKLKKEPDYELCYDIIGLMIDFYQEKKKSELIKMDFINNLMLCIKSVKIEDQEQQDFIQYVEQVLKS